jgi:spermidine/putrescine transport system ATP-binding protein
MHQFDLELRDVTKRFGHFTAVSHMNLQVQKGELCCLLGPSGCGKTTTLRLIAGLEEVSGGEIFIKGERVNDIPPWDRDIAMMFQNYALFPHMTVQKQVAFGLEMMRCPRTQIAERVARILEMLEIQSLAERKPDTLSGGQLQRVALARSLITEPSLLLLDEPIGALDYNLRQTVMVELKKLQRRLGITFIWVTHDQNEALSMADKVVVMDHAVVEQIGTPQGIFETPKTRFVASFMQGNNLFVGQVIALHDNLAIVQTAVGTFTMPLRQKSVPALQETVSFSVRAQRVTTGEGPTYTNTVLGTFRSIEYFGSIVTYALDLDNGADFKMEQYERTENQRIPKEGERVKLRWRPEDTILHEKIQHPKSLF